MSTTMPTAAQLAVLKLLVAGLHLYAPADHRTRYSLRLSRTHPELKTVAASRVRPMVEAGWLERRTGTARLVLTAAGRALAEVPAFVRAFSDAAAVVH